MFCFESVVWRQAIAGKINKRIVYLIAELIPTPSLCKRHLYAFEKKRVGIIENTELALD